MIDEAASARRGTRLASKAPIDRLLSSRSAIQLSDSWPSIAPHRKGHDSPLGHDHSFRLPGVGAGKPQGPPSPPRCQLCENLHQFDRGHHLRHARSATDHIPARSKEQRRTANLHTLARRGIDPARRHNPRSRGHNRAGSRHNNCRRRRRADRPCRAAHRWSAPRPNSGNSKRHRAAGVGGPSNT